MRSHAITLTVALSLAACGTPKTPAQLETGLESPNPSVRRDSADELREDDHVRPEALPKLYAAIDKEKDPEAYGAMLITLGVSGDADAKPWICKNIDGGTSTDDRMKRWAGHALTEWLHKNSGQPGCTGMSTIEEVPKSEGPSPTKARPVAPKAGIFSPGM